MKNKSNLFTNINDDYYTKKKYSFQEAAKALNIKEIGRNTLMDFLRWKGVLTDSNIPNKDLDYKDYFIIERSIGNKEAIYVTRVTPTGLHYLESLVNKYFQEYLEFKKSSKS